MIHFASKALPPFVYPVGMVCCLLAAALVWAFPRRLRYTLTVVALAVLLLGSNRLVSFSLVRSLEWQHETPLPAAVVNDSAALTDALAGLDTEVIVVLGGGTRGRGSPRAIPEMNEAGDRLLYAAWLYQQFAARGASPHILVSGGNVAGWTGPNSYTEAEEMAAILGIMGVPRGALWLEEQSRNTYENAVESRKILAEKDVERVLLVTSATHMPRAHRLFVAQGLDVIPMPTDFIVTYDDWRFFTHGSAAVQLFNVLPDAEYLALTTRCLKEYIGMFYYTLFGWR